MFGHLIDQICISYKLQYCTNPRSFFLGTNTCIALAMCQAFVVTDVCVHYLTGSLQQPHSTNKQTEAQRNHISCLGCG